MRRKFAISCYAAVLSLIAFGQMSVVSQNTPQSVFGEWKDVMALQLGERIELRLKKGRNLKGTVDAVFNSGISVLHEGKLIMTDRGDVKRVYRVIQEKSNRPLLVGAAIGTVIGIGGTAAVAATNDAGGVRAGAVVLPAIGALTGGLVGLTFRNRTKKVLIFEQK